MEPHQRLAQLLRSASVAQSDVELVCAHFQVERFRKQTRVVIQGRTYGKLLYVAEGILSVFVTTPDGGKVIKNFIEANGFFADLESIERNHPAVVNVATVTDATLLTLSRADAARLAKSFPAWDRLMQEGARRAMYEMVRQQEFLRIGTSADQYRHFARHFPNLIAEVPLKDIASYLRITQSSLSRIRKQRR